MLNIYAQSLMTATRMNIPRITDAPVTRDRPNVPRRHRWNRAPRQVDLSNL